MATNQHFPEVSDVLPYPVYFRLSDYQAHQQFEYQTHPWGQLTYCSTGVMEIMVDGQRYLAPPQYAVWIPPETLHDGYIRQDVTFHSAYIDASLCPLLPAKPCALVLSPLLKAILADFAERKVTTPVSTADQRLAQVVIDQLQLAPCSRNYLPGSDDPITKALLDGLQADPGSNRSLADWAAQLHVTERTLARRCQRELGMSFGEWRQRQRFLAAMPLLERGDTVQAIALELGYSTASAFIAMFRRQSGGTPDQFRRNLRCKQNSIETTSSAV
ncbi:helix-turn-helix transcriptional regulator [Janthinobacterium sp.]|uniref:AraC family transcriptional regulator n=1 Tax=Janthinobacterium sp. TaxID=1871054 RepID=UPI0026386AE7|nr:helix-turn-helix transcriptional regulator [Janthinobacterium sp.]